MSNKVKGLRIVAAPVLLALVAGFAGSGCSEAADAAGLDCELEGRIDALNASVSALTDAAVEMKGIAVGACAAIAGEAEPTGEVTDDQVTEMCDKAAAKIEAEFMAAGSISVAITPGKCSVDAKAQLDCEGSCTAKADCACEGGDVTARCDPGELSVKCEGTCEVGATCQGSADVAVECTGACEGTCEGTCDAECAGNTASGGMCNGECTGTCEGTCKGSCTIEAEAGVMCSGEATCKGGCEGTATAPSCEAELTPLMCDCEAAADCNADCSGQASLKAECTPPSVEIVGNLNAEFATTLKANLPKLLQVVAKGELAVKAAGNVAGSVGELAGELSGSCLASGGQAIVGAVQGSLAASASVSVSVNASASASGKASSG